MPIFEINKLKFNPFNLGVIKPWVHFQESRIKFSFPFKIRRKFVRPPQSSSKAQDDRFSVMSLYRDWASENPINLIIVFIISIKSCLRNVSWSVSKYLIRLIFVNPSAWTRVYTLYILVAYEFLVLWQVFPKKKDELTKLISLIILLCKTE